MWIRHLEDVTRANIRSQGESVLQGAGIDGAMENEERSLLGQNRSITAKSDIAGKATKHLLDAHRDVSKMKKS